VTKISRRKFAVLFMLGGIVLCALPAISHLAGYSKSNSGLPVRDHWRVGFPIQWNLNLKTGNNIQGSRNVAQVIQASFQTWLQAPNAALNASRGPDDPSVTSGNNSPANENVICFVCSADFGGAETLAIAFTRIVSAAGAPDGHGGITQFPGQIIKGDIFFNPKVDYTTGGTAGQDMQTVATHEIGHLFGLDHSGIVRPVMFPFAPDSLQTLSYDDVAGISALYPRTPADVPVGVISGTVRMANTAAPVFGAHVYANSVTTADPFAGRNIRKTPVGTLTMPDGSYRIEGVPADSYMVIVEPLDLPVTSDDVPDYGDAFGRTLQTNFTTRWR